MWRTSTAQVCCTACVLAVGGCNVRQVEGVIYSERVPIERVHIEDVCAWGKQGVCAGVYTGGQQAAKSTHAHYKENTGGVVVCFSVNMQKNTSICVVVLLVSLVMNRCLSSGLLCTVCCVSLCCVLSLPCTMFCPSSSVSNPTDHCTCTDDCAQVQMIVHMCARHVVRLVQRGG